MVILNIKNYFIIVFIFIISCNNKNANSNAIEENIKDRAGNNIIIPSKIDKIISLSPAVTDILLSMLKGNEIDKIISVDTVSKDILEDNNIDTSNMLFFDMLNPDAEKIIALEPDIIFVNTFSVFSGKNSLDSIKNTGLCIAVMPNSDTLSGIEDDIIFLGKALKMEDITKKIILEMKINIDRIKSIGDKITNKKEVYFEIGAMPNLYTFGTNVYLDDMINIIGGKNIFRDRNSWITVSEEKVISANPDAIFTSAHYINSPVEEILNRIGWQNIKAIKNKEVYYSPINSLPSNNIIDFMFYMAKSLYPKEYKDIEIYKIED